MNPEEYLEVRADIMVLGKHLSREQAEKVYQSLGKALGYETIPPARFEFHKLATMDEILKTGQYAYELFPNATHSRVSSFTPEDDGIGQKFPIFMGESTIIPWWVNTQKYMWSHNPALKWSIEEQIAQPQRRLEVVGIALLDELEGLEGGIVVLHRLLGLAPPDQRSMVVWIEIQEILVESELFIECAAGAQQSRQFPVDPEVAPVILDGAAKGLLGLCVPSHPLVDTGQSHLTAHPDPLMVGQPLGHLHGMAEALTIHVDLV